MPRININNYEVEDNKPHSTKVKTNIKIKKMK